MGIFIRMCLLFSLFLFAGLSTASQTISDSMSFRLFQYRTTYALFFNSDITVRAIVTLANDTNGNGPRVIYLPKNMQDYQDLFESPDGPNGPGIYACPGTFKLILQEDSTWANSMFSSNTSYPTNNTKLCPNRITGRCNSLCFQECPGRSETSGRVQWSNNQSFIDFLKDGLTVPYIPEELSYYWGNTCTNLQVNVNYRPGFNSDRTYPNQPGEAGLLCVGFENVSLDGRPMARSDGAISPVLLSSPHNYPCDSISPIPPSEWAVGPLSTEGLHVVEANIGSEQCLGLVHNLPDIDPRPNSSNRKDIFQYRRPDSPSLSVVPQPARWRVYVVDPQDCNISVDALSCRTRDLVETSHDINITNPSSLVDVSINNISLISPPAGWNIAIDTSLPLIIQSNNSSIVRVNLTPTQPIPSGLQELILRINFSTQLCSGECINYTDISLPLCNGDDLASLIVAPSFVPVDPPTSFNIDVYTWNNGARNTPITTNTSVNINDLGQDYYEVPEGIVPGALGSDGLPYPPESYVKKTYTAVCKFPHFIIIDSKADWDNRLAEMDEQNNYAHAQVQCGAVFGCYDYI